jgi:hypothetical protein
MSNFAACKWLSKFSTFTPSGRIFSICGNVNSAQQSRMKGDAIAAQMLMYNNTIRLNFSQTEQVALLA